MFGNLFKRKPKGPIYVTARINDRVMPIDRGDLYEDPLHEFLEQRKLGSVAGGGTQLNDAKEIEYCDVELELNATDAQTLATVKSALEHLGVPRGSKLLLPDGQEMPIGKIEGIAVYINGTDLPEHVYQECDINVVHEEFQRLLGDRGTIHSHFRGPTETVLNMYGNSFAEMQQLLSGFMASYPLCERARVVRIA